MCGIAGMLSLNMEQIPHLRRALAVMNGLQRHRGPDGEGVWMHPAGHVGFAHRRISVIDLKTGQQPMRDRSGNWVTYNGEIYNYRFQNVYGPGEILGAGRWRGTPSTVWRNVTPTFIYRAVKRLPLKVENQGLASRDFIYVEDIARGLMRCASVVYNLASGVETSILELATLINELTGNPASIEFLAARPWDRSGKRFGSPEKAKREIGFQSRVLLSDGLSTTVEWTRKNLQRIDRCIQKHDSQMKVFS